MNEWMSDVKPPENEYSFQQLVSHLALLVLIMTGLKASMYVFHADTIHKPNE